MGGPLTYRQGRLQGIPRDHFHGHAGLGEDLHGVLHAHPRRVDDSHKTQKGQLPQFGPRSQGQHCGESRPTEVSPGPRGPVLAAVSPGPTRCHSSWQ